MNEELFAEAVERWETPDSELIYNIDIIDGSVEHIVKRDNLYFIYRYFMLDIRVAVSVDLNGVNSDRIITYLAERIS